MKCTVVAAADVDTAEAKPNSIPNVYCHQWHVFVPECIVITQHAIRRKQENSLPEINHFKTNLSSILRLTNCSV